MKCRKCGSGEMAVATYGTKDIDPLADERWDYLMICYNCWYKGPVRSTREEAREAYLEGEE